MNIRTLAFPLLSALAAGGCISVKTESEIKPIHITMDVNLRVDKELDKAFQSDDKPAPQGAFKEVKAALDRKAVGLTYQALLEARSGATDDDKMLVAEENARRLKRFGEIAKSTGVTVTAVQRRRYAKLLERLPAGSGVWVQGADGKWFQR